MDAGTIVAIGAVLLFYMRMMGMQWGKAKRLRQQRALDLQELKKKKGKKTEPQPDRPRPSTGVTVRSWPMVISGLVLCVVAAILAAIPGTQPFWWIPITIAMVILTFSFK